MAKANTENTYTGDGVTTEYTITFEYVNTTDVEISIDDLAYTEFSFIDATTIDMDTAPAMGAKIRIYRSSNLTSLPHTFFPGSAIRAQDLNQDFEQILFVAQETQRDSDYAFNAVPIAAEAREIANEAKATADQAATDAIAAVNTANDAEAEVQVAVMTAGSAVATALEAESIAEDAKQVADSAAELVASANLPISVNTLADLPASPVDNDLYRVLDSTGIESFSPLTGLPSGFVGDAGSSVTINYLADSWTYLSYSPTDPDSRYLRLNEEAGDQVVSSAGDTVFTGSVGIGGVPSSEKLSVVGQVKASEGIVFGDDSVLTTADPFVNKYLIKAFSNLPGLS